MAKNWQDLSLAMAGIFQATALVDQIARTGYVPNDAYETCLHSLFQQNPTTSAEIFGGADKLEMGLGIMSTLFTMKADKEHPNTMRYVMGVLHLQSKLAKKPDMLSVIASRLEQAERQMDHFGSISHDTVVSNLADIYTNTLSGFKFRIQVSGDINYLQQTRVANQIRALLFAGIRSAMLWRQLGGSRLQIIFQRKKLQHSAQQWLQSFSA